MNVIRRRYDLLVGRWRERWPEDVPPPFPEDVHEQVNTIHILRARLTGETPTKITMGEGYRPPPPKTPPPKAA